MKIKEIEVKDGDNNSLDKDIKLYQYENDTPKEIGKEDLKKGKNFYICEPKSNEFNSINVSMRTEEIEVKTNPEAEFLLLEPEEKQDSEYQNFIMAKGKSGTKKDSLSATFSVNGGTLIVKRDSISGEPLEGAKFIIARFGCLGNYEEIKNNEMQGSYVSMDSFKGGAEGYWNNYASKYNQRIGEYVYIGSKNMEYFKENEARTDKDDFQVFKKWQVYRENGADKENPSISWTDIKGNPNGYSDYIYKTNAKGEIAITIAGDNIRYYVMEIEAPPGYTIDKPNEWSEPILIGDHKKISYGNGWDGVITNSNKR